MPKKTRKFTRSVKRKSGSKILREDSSLYRANGTPGVGKLRFVDLFCGIGGFRIAFDRAGAECVFSSDWDKYAQLTYAANFGETRMALS